MNGQYRRFTGIRSKQRGDPEAWASCTPKSEDDHQSPLPSESMRLMTIWCGPRVYGRRNRAVTECLLGVDIVLQSGYDASRCGNNSVVECNLAKVEVAGSNPVSRSKRNQIYQWIPPKEAEKLLRVFSF